ncbi:MAG: pdz/dhr/glgf protein [Arcanobacterium sp.]|nr:pdz/dhr/glgf protein [Arcanobacterium sp.]MDY5589001.1 S16 family serine protease [Arcanobacterium sp.]
MRPIDSSRDPLRGRRPHTARGHASAQWQAREGVRAYSWPVVQIQRMHMWAALLAVLVAVALVMPTSFVVEGAGPALNVNGVVASDSAHKKPVVAVSGVPTYATESAIFLTTVSSWGTVNSGVPGFEALRALLSADYQLLPVRMLYPDSSTEQAVEAQNKQLMASSQDSAAAVAFDLAGLPVHETLTVMRVDKKYPAAAVLQKGDVITGIRRVVRGGSYTQVENFMDLSSFLAEVNPGQEVQLAIERDGYEQEVSTVTVARHVDQNGTLQPGAMLGVGIGVTNIRIPGKVSYGVTDIGGPSAGLMFTLGIYDQLTEGSLAGTTPLGGTGTMEWDGKVGPIGGIVHKMRGAAKHNVKNFLAPRGNCAQTIGHEPAGMHVWAVSTAAEAIAAAKAIAAGNTSTLTPCAAVGNSNLGK